MQTDETDAKREELHTGDTQLDKKNVTIAPRVYTVDHKARQREKGNNVKDVLRWYSYLTAGNMVQPPACIPEHFITRF